MTDFSTTIAATADDGQATTAGANFSTTQNALTLGKFSTTLYHNFFRFISVTIPDTAIIDSAVIRFTCYQSLSDNTVNVNVHFEAADDPAAPVDGADLIGRSLGAAVAWDAIPAWTIGNTYDTPDLTAELQAVINRGGWNSGQAVIVHTIDNNSVGSFPRRNASDYSDAVYFYTPAQLIVTYHEAYQASNVESVEISESVTIETDLVRQENISLVEYIDAEMDFVGFIPTITQDIEISEYVEIAEIDLGDISTSESIEITESVSIELSVLPDFTLSVSAGADDGYTGTASPFNIRASEYAMIGKYNTDPLQAYFRFDNVPILGGVNAVIDSAILRVESQTTSSNNSCNVTIHFQAHDNPGAFAVTAQGGTDILTANLTSGIDSDIEDWIPGEVSESPQLKTILQEVIDRPGWDTGQAITVHILDNGSDTNAYRRIKTYDYFPSNSAQLIISYTIPFHLLPNENISISESVTIKFSLEEHENITIQESITMGKSVIDMPGQDHSIEISESVTMERGFSGTLPTITQNVRISESISALLDLNVSESESLTITEYGANIRPEPYALENVNLTENIEVYRGFEKEVDDSFEISDSFVIFNYTKWLRDNVGKISQRFFFTLTGAADLLTDIEIPASSIYARKRSGNPTYLQVTVPSFNYAEEISSRPSGAMVIDIGYLVNGVVDIRETILEADLEDISTYEGPVNRSVVLSGRKTVTYGGNLITFERIFATYKALQNQIITYRFPFIDPFVNPGDTVTVGDDSFTVENIVYIINDFESTMQLTEGS